MQKTEETHANDAVRQRIIDYATQLFFEKGIRDVTMDAISQGLKMSKRTLYQQFADKEQLIIACAEKRIAKTKETTMEMVSNKCDIIEIMLWHIEERLHFMANISEKYVFDINHYPALKAYFDTFKQELYTEGAEFIRQGVRDGSLRAEVKPEIAIRYIFHNNHAFTYSSDFQDYSQEDIFFNTSFIYMRGWCTQKGLEALDHFYEKYQSEHAQHGKTNR